MANPSKQRPWVMQMKARDQWFNVDAFRSEDEATLQIALARERSPQTEWRIHNYTDSGASK